MPIVSANAAQIALVGVFPGKAVLVIDGGKPRAIAVGQSLDGVKVLSVDRDSAVVDIDGQKNKLMMGSQPVNIGSANGSNGAASATLNADGRGHFLGQGRINGASVRFLVDTGASSIAMSAASARNAGIDYRKGTPGYTSTANGVAPMWQVRLDSVTVGGITLNNIEGVVLEGDLPIALLGMSFLNRVEMKRNGDTMTLTQKY